MADFKKSTLREYFESIVIAVILALFIRTFVVQAFKIPTGSMEENLLIGDHLLVNKFVFGATETPVERALLPIGTIKRRDIIVFKYPESRIAISSNASSGCRARPWKCVKRRSTSTARPSTSHTCTFWRRRAARPSSTR